MRFVIAIATLFFVAPLDAQDRIFRASSIDLEQNERLDSLESRVAALEAPKAEVESLPSPPVTIAPPPVVAVPPVAAKLKPVPQPQRVVQPAPVRQAVAQSARYALSELRALIQRLRPGGWRGAQYADVSPHSLAWNHLVSEHGFSWEQVSGLSQSEALILHDLAHGRLVSPMRSQRSVPVQPAQQVVQSYQQSYQYFGTKQSYGVGCANGQCASQQSYSSRVPILRRIFR